MRKGNLGPRRRKCLTNIFVENSRNLILIGFFKQKVITNTQKDTMSDDLLQIHITEKGIFTF